jgi:hypothetical protein
MRSFNYQALQQVVVSSILIRATGLEVVFTKSGLLAKI